MKRFGPALAWTLALGAAPAAADWEHHYYAPQAADEMAVCTAGVYYSDGPFVTRVYERTVDFYLADEEFSLPSERALGTVVFAFRDIDFVLEADSGWEDHGGRVGHLFLTPRDADVEPILGRIRSEREMRIVFPDGLAYIIELGGSSAAIDEAFACWSREITGTMGHASSDPFEDSAARVRDPFR